MSITDLLDQLDGVKGGSGRWMARCPSHADRSPSLSVDEGEDGRLLLLCFGGCDTHDVVAAMGLTMRDLAGDTDATGTPFTPRERAVPSPQDEAQLGRLVAMAADRLKGPGVDNHPAVKYARDRFGLTTEDVQRLDLGYMEWLAGGPRLVVPFKDKQGVVRAMQARALDDSMDMRWYSYKGRDWSTVGWFPSARQYAAVVVTEGPGDALTAVAAGFNAIGIRGSSNAKSQYTQTLVAEMIGDSHAVICGDGDDSGSAFNRSLYQALRSQGSDVRILRVAPGFDLTDLRRTGGDQFVPWFRDRVVA